MSRRASTSVRILCILAAVALAAQIPLGNLGTNRAAAQALPSVTLTKSVNNVSTGGAPGPSATASTGQVLQYIINYSNPGSTAAMPLTIQDTLTPGQTYNTGSCGTTTAGSSCAFASGTVTFTVPLPAGSSGSAVFQTTVTGTASPILNQAQDSATGFAPSSSNTTTVTVAGAPPPTGAGILTLTKTVGDLTRGTGQGESTFAAPGDKVQYQLTVSNTSPTTTATGVTITDTIQGFQNIAATGFTCGPSGVTCTLNGNVVTFSLGNLAPGQTVTVAFNVYISNAAVNAQQIYDQGTACASNATCVNSNSTVIEVSSPVVVTPPCGYCGAPCATACTAPCGGYFACGTPCFNPCNTGCNYNPCNTCNYNPCNTCGYNACNTCGYNPCNTCNYNPCNTCNYNPCNTGCNYNPCNTCNYNPCNTCNYNPCHTCNVNPCTGCGYNACGSPCGVNVCGAPYATNVVCGNVATYTPASATAAGVVVMNGATYQVVPGTNFAGTVVAPGYASCFLLNQQSYITGCLSSIPVAATAAEKPMEFHKVGKLEAF